MKRCFTLIALSIAAVLGIGSVINGPVVPPVGGYTLLESSLTTANAWPIGDTANGATQDIYAGQLNWSNASARNIGKVVIKMTKTAGSITGKTYTCRIWTMSGTTLGTNVASSTSVVGSDSWSATDVDFIFSSPYLTTGSTNYAFTIDSGDVTGDGSNYASAYFQNATPIAGDLAYWDVSKANTAAFSGFNFGMAIYTTP